MMLQFFLRVCQLLALFLMNYASFSQQTAFFVYFIWEYRCIELGYCPLTLEAVVKLRGSVWGPTGLKCLLFFTKWQEFDQNTAEGTRKHCRMASNYCRKDLQTLPNGMKTLPKLAFLVCLYVIIEYRYLLRIGVQKWDAYRWHPFFMEDHYRCFEGKFAAAWARRRRWKK